MVASFISNRVVTCYVILSPQVEKKIFSQEANLVIRLIILGSSCIQILYSLYYCL